MHRMRTLLTVIAVLMLALLGGVAQAEAAHAAVSCTYGGCDGKDPQANGCSTDATTIYTVNPTMGKVELRRSAACHAFWTRGTTNEVTGGTLWVIRYLNSSDSVGTAKTKALGANSSGWTPMLGENSTYLRGFKACGQNSGETGKTCTPKAWF